MVSVFLSCFPHCVYRYGCSATPSMSLSTSDLIFFYYVVDPADVIGDPRVDPRLVRQSAPITPAGHTHQSHLVLVFTDKGATRVSLWVKFKKQILETNNVIRTDLWGWSVNIQCSHLAGIVQVSGVTCTQHVGGNWASRQHLWDTALIGPKANITSLNTLRVLCRNCGEKILITTLGPIIQRVQLQASQHCPLLLGTPTTKVHAYILCLFRSLRSHIRSIWAARGQVQADTLEKPPQSLQHRCQCLFSASTELQWRVTRGRRVTQTENWGVI